MPADQVVSGFQEVARAAAYLCRGLPSSPSPHEVDVGWEAGSLESGRSAGLPPLRARGPLSSLHPHQERHGLSFLKTTVPAGRNETDPGLDLSFGM